VHPARPSAVPTIIERLEIIALPIVTVCAVSACIQQYFASE
jgi:hypothetical protein